MTKFFKKIFTSEACLVLGALLGIIGNFGLAVINVLAPVCEYTESMDYVNFSLRLLEALCIFVLFVSFKTHNKNLMKGVLGVLITANFVLSVNFIDYIIYDGKMIDVIFLLFNIVLTIIFSVNHFVINSQRQASPVNIGINQITSILLILVSGIGWSIYDFITYREWYTTIVDAFEIIGYFGVMVVIVCIESRLDAYRLNREAAGWTEEQGYPEGYVHEIEK